MTGYLQITQSAPSLLFKVHLKLSCKMSQSIIIQKWMIIHYYSTEDRWEEYLCCKLEVAGLSPVLLTFG